MNVEKYKNYVEVKLVNQGETLQIPQDENIKILIPENKYFQTVRKVTAHKIARTNSPISSVVTIDLKWVQDELFYLYLPIKDYQPDFFRSLSWTFEIEVVGDLTFHTGTYEVEPKRS